MLREVTRGRSRRDAHLRPVAIRPSASSVEGDNDSRSPSPQSPPVGRGRINELNGLFNIPMGGGEGAGEGVGHPDRTLPRLQHQYPIRDGYSARRAPGVLLAR